MAQIGGCEPLLCIHQPYLDFRPPDVITRQGFTHLNVDQRESSFAVDEMGICHLRVPNKC